MVIAGVMVKVANTAKVFTKILIKSFIINVDSAMIEALRG
jgi:hypothetical protein